MEADYIEALAQGTFAAYCHRWDADNNYLLLGSEVLYESPLYNVDTMRPSRKHTLVGVLDKVAHRDGEEGCVIIDHKTTSVDIEDPSSDYWQHLRLEPQPSQYSLLAHANGQRVAAVIWDVIRRPAFRPKKNIGRQEWKTLEAESTYGGYVIPADRRPETALDAESPYLFAVRVFSEIQHNPARYFQRRSVTRTDDELADYLRDVWSISKEILQSKSSNRWPKNAKACLLYGSPCEYLGLCSGFDTEESDHWVKRTSPVELTLPHDGQRALSCSALSCYLTCRQQYYYRYELGITKDKEASTALTFGRIMHEKLDEYWKGQYANSSKETELPIADTDNR